MNTQKPLVTVVITCYNYAHYLGDAIESALAQTHQPLEVIVVDDGSTDNTWEVAARYPVRVVTQTNQGLSAATNAGVRASTGEFVVRLDADDVLYPTFVEETLAALEQYPRAALAHTDSEFFGTRTGRAPFKPFDAEALAEGAMTTCCSLFRRSAWDAVGGLDPTMVLCEDWDLWLTFAERNMPGVMVRKVLWGYRQHGPSMVNRKKLTWSGLRREYALISQLQDRHPAIFAPAQLIRRLLSAPRRVFARQLSTRQLVLLFAFYGVMLARRAAGQNVNAARPLRLPSSP